MAKNDKGKKATTVYYLGGPGVGGADAKRKACCHILIRLLPVASERMAKNTPES